MHASLTDVKKMFWHEGVEGNNRRKTCGQRIQEATEKFVKTKNRILVDSREIGRFDTKS